MVVLHSFTVALSVLFTILPAASAQTYPNPEPVSGNIATHDPSALCKRSDGLMFVFSTAPGIDIRTTTDRVNFNFVGSVWPNGAATWTDKYTLTSNGNLWAPDCVYRNGQFWLYYSASSFGSQNSAIFLAKSTTGMPGTWSNEGVVVSSSTGGQFNAIDPHLFIEGSNWWLSYGSWWNGIALVQLNSSTGKPQSGATTTNIAKRNPISVGIEAPIIFKYGSYYYLFTSWDNCCQGTSSTYNIRVGRASSITGPYVDKSGVNLVSGGGTLLLPSHDSVIGPGGQTVYQDGSQVILAYHYYTSSGHRLGLNYLDFSSGWPVVSKASGGTSTTTRTTSTRTTSTTRTTASTTRTTTTGSSGTVPLYGQCGGQGYTGPTTCQSPAVCKFSNEWYSQCLNP